jgi:hypothetical protein
MESGHYAPGLAFVSLHGEHDLSSDAVLTPTLDNATKHSNVLVDLSACAARGEQVVLAIPPGQQAGHPMPGNEREAVTLIDAFLARDATA